MAKHDDLYTIFGHHLPHLKHILDRNQKYISQAEWRIEEIADTTPSEDLHDNPEVKDLDAYVTLVSKLTQLTQEAFDLCTKAKNARFPDG